MTEPRFRIVIRSETVIEMDEAGMRELTRMLPPGTAITPSTPALPAPKVTGRRRKDLPFYVAVLALVILAALVL
jgi:hypothetical protein